MGFDRYCLHNDLLGLVSDLKRVATLDSHKSHKQTCLFQYALEITQSKLYKRSPTKGMPEGRRNCGTVFSPALVTVTPSHYAKTLGD